MDDNQQELLDIVTQVKAHLEYQKALGVKAIAIPVSTGVGRSMVSVSTDDTHPVVFAPAKRESTEKAASSVPVIKPGITPAQTSTLSAIQQELNNCIRCKLHKSRKTIVFGEGNPEAQLVFVGEAPGSEEDLQGKPFVGEVGQLLTDIIVKGMKLKREQIYVCTVLKCRLPVDQIPAIDELAACEPFLRKQLLAIKPRVIVTLGNAPTQALLRTKEGIEELRGKWQTYEGIPLMPTLPPAQLLKNPKDKALVWEDIKKVIAVLDKTVKNQESGA